MAQSTTADAFVRAAAKGMVPGSDPAAAAAPARTALEQALQDQRSIVLEAQFTGFTHRGEAVGGLEPAVLRAAAQLIMLRVNRLGFTADADAGALETLFGIVARPPGELVGGVIAALEAAQPAGIYVSTASNEVYKPDAAAPPADAAPAQSGAASAAETESEESTDFADFQLLDAPPELGTMPAAPPAPAPAPDARTPETEAADDALFHFFRATAAPVPDADAAQLIASLHGADNLARYTELARTVAREAVSRLESGDPSEAVKLVRALAAETERQDRTRIFRDSALQELRTLAVDGPLQQLLTLLEARAEARGGLLPLFSLLGAQAAAAVEALLFRTGDATLRESIFRALVARQGSGTQLLERTLAEAQPARARSVLALGGADGIDPATARQWIEAACKHDDAAVRADAARNAGRIPGRQGLRLLIDLLSDSDPAVRRAAVQALGTRGEPAAVPFLARILNDSNDEEAELEVLTAFRRIAAPETLPTLLSVLNRRQLFGGKRLIRLKLAALEAAAAVDSRAARDVLAAWDRRSSAEK